MPDPNALTLDTPEAEQQAANDLYRNRVADKRTGGKKKKPLADQALEVLSQSPAGANPWIRAILVANNIFNRLIGKPPNSAEHITIAVQIGAAFVVVFLVLFAAVNLLFLDLIVFYATHSELAQTTGLFVALIRYLGLGGLIGLGTP